MTVELCDALDSMKIDTEKKMRDHLGVNTSLYGAQLVLKNLCLGCECAICSQCVFSDLARLVEAVSLPDIAVSSPVPLPVIAVSSAPEIENTQQPNVSY